MSTCHLLYASAQAAVTKCHRLGSLSNRHLVSHSSGGEKCGVTLWAGLVSEASLLSLQTAFFSLCLHTVFLCVCVHEFPVYHDTGHIGIGPTLMTSL